MDFWSLTLAAALAGSTLALLRFASPKPQAPEPNQRDMVPITAPGKVNNPVLHVAGFLQQTLRPAHHGQVSVKDLYDRYLLWTIERNVGPLDSADVGRLFLATLIARGFTYERTANDVVVKGAELDSAPTRGLPKLLADLSPHSEGTPA